MSKDKKSFGFKDRAKAEETLHLLESHDMAYRKTTVKGLLERANRVLFMTKAQDKIKNIKEAIEVFEKWLADLDLNKKTDKKTPEKKEKEDKNGEKEEQTLDVEMDGETEKEKQSKEKAKDVPLNKVPNLGYKNKEAAECTFKELEGRDPEYQRLVIKHLMWSAKKILNITRNETKLANIKEAIVLFEKFLDDYKTNHMKFQNNEYVSLARVKTCLAMGVTEPTEHQKAFLAAYESVGGDYKRLRTIKENEDGKTWDIVRNAVLKDLKEKHADSKLFTDDYEPTREHLEMLFWAYSPVAPKVKRLIPETKKDEEHNESRKRPSSGHSDDDVSKKKKED